MILAIDFDGTICRGKYPAIDGQQPYAAETINALYDAGHYIIINTCRSNDVLLTAINWLISQGIRFHRVNDNHPEQTALYKNNSRKIYAHIYVDDKNLGGFPGWHEARRIIEQAEADYQAARTDAINRVSTIN